ncbi:MAG: pyridoxine 5'-phosphate synthase, partial [Acidobacteriota bacterium]|nr:pyridoxine 5'-phosphate synthase [Acidobacteriota bacterium]
MTQLSVNLNKVALLRNTRDVGVPDVLRAARIAIDAGASGITVHPRPDERHTRPSDVLDLSTFTKEAAVEFNIEGYPTTRFLELVHQVVPVQCTLVPDAPDQRTADHGWDLEADGVRLRPIIVDLKARGIRVSLFMDPDPAIIAAAAAVGTDRVEIYTEPYARAFGTPEQAMALDACANCAAEAERA